MAGAAVLVAACGSSGKSNAGNTGSATTSSTTAQVATGTPTQGGTVTWAEGAGQTPDYIFPLAPFADFSVANLSQFQELMYRPLYWFGDAGKPTVDYNRSVAPAPKFTDNNSKVTITLDSDYTWSDGEKLDARDVVFWMNLLKAEKANWAGYVPGYFPDNVVSMSMPDGPTGRVVVFKLDKSYNPTWFIYNELSQITPLPIAWDKTSAGGKTPTASEANLPDTTPAGAAKVYDFLNTAAKTISSYGSSPIWSVVDGPWKLQGLTSTGQATFVPNTKYTGPNKPHLSKFVEVPFASDAAEYNSVKAGPAGLQVGYIPTQNAVPAQVASVKGEGFTSTTDYLFGFNYLAINFNNAKVGKIFSQLYVRQALQYLVDQSGWIKAFDANLAAPTYGPVPVEPANSFADPFEKSDPYPYNVSKAKSLLASHGWKVVPGGTSTCQDPGSGPTQCGAGIAKGAGLSFNLEYASGLQFLTSSMDNYKQEAATIGVQFNLSTASFDDVISTSVPCKTGASNCGWQIGNWGQGWIYAPDYYASGEELYATGAGSNAGSYASPQANALIAKTTTVGQPQSQGALNSYQDFIAKQLPVIFQPYPAGSPSAGLNVVSDKLGNVQPNVFGNLTPEDWYYIKK